MKDLVSIPFPYIRLDKNLNIVDFNNIYESWNKNNIKTIYDLVDGFDEKKSKQFALIENICYDVYTTSVEDGFDVIFIENPYLNKEGLGASNILAGILIVDNIAEIQETMDEIRFPHFNAIIERKINEYFNNMGGLVTKFDNSKYIFILNKNKFNLLKEDKFSIVEQIGNVEMGNDVPATLSIGIGMNGCTVNEDMVFARGALDLALGRGGNQIVIKEGEDKYAFFGGDGREISKNSRVRARVKASGLVELIMSSSDVIVMGHKDPDLDSLGSASGIYAIAKFYDKKCKIVLNNITSSISALYERLCDTDRYENAFISSSEALSTIKRGTLLVVVDTHREFLTECPELLKVAKTIVLIDHHRMSTEAIDEKCALVYHESYASSASELVTEMIMHIKGIRLIKTEIEGLLAGITVDTKNFAFKTGIKTFEAAAYLKKNGADTMSVRRLFKNSFDEYLVRSEIVRNSELIFDNMAISVMNENVKVDNPILLIAQSADELLNLNDIEASFVLCKYGDKVCVSARSLGKINVQKLMEMIGGGGHQTGAAAQIKGVCIDEAIEILKQKIKEYLEEE